MTGKVDNVGMIRPCYLVVDREFASSISTRKLVIETAKLNVITAYSGAEALATLEKFPAVHGVVMDANLADISCDKLVEGLKKIQPNVTIIAISGPGGKHCKGADHQLETFEPAQLLELLKKLKPKESAAIEARNEELQAQQR